MTQIKICGLQPSDDLEFSKDERVHYIGVIFVPASKRYVEPLSVRPMVERVAQTARVMGVFAGSSIGEILPSLKESGVHGAQLHGQESPKTCLRLREEGYEVWKALKVSDGVSPPELLRRILAYQDSVDAVLLDAAPPSSAESAVTGGYGRTFDWSVLDYLAEERLKGMPRLWVAGGLNPENVGSLLGRFRPFGVDVSSGVELEGRKDLKKISAFIEAVKRSA